MTWDPYCSPSTYHGVTTVAFGQAMKLAVAAQLPPEEVDDTEVQDVDAKTVMDLMIVTQYFDMMRDGAPSAQPDLSR